MENLHQWFPGLIGRTSGRFEFRYVPTATGRQLTTIRDLREGVVITRTQTGAWEWHEKGGRVVRRWGIELNEAENGSLQIRVQGSTKSYLHNADGSVVIENNDSLILYKKRNGELRPVAARVQNDLVLYGDDGMAEKIEFACGQTLVRTHAEHYLLTDPDGSTTVVHGDVWPDEERGGYRYRLSRSHGAVVAECNFVATGNPRMPVRSLIHCPAS